METACKRTNIYERQDSWSPRRKVFRHISQEQLNESIRKRVVINECLDILIHSRNCINDKCTSQRCISMKNVWKHFGACPENKKSSPKCPICNSVISLLHYHAKDCQFDSCTMPRCRELKDGFFAKWQKAQQTFLSNVVKFRLSAVPTVIKRQSKKINAKPSVQTIENNSQKYSD